MDRAPVSEPAPVPAVARLLGLAGLLPAAGAAAVLAFRPVPGLGPLAAQAGAVYAALILSFLGGTWWGFAARAATAQASFYVLAVLPALAGWALLIGLAPARIVALGLLLLACLPVDRLLVARGLAPGWWMRLRLPLSLGLGALTIMIGLLSARVPA